MTTTTDTGPLSEAQEAANASVDEQANQDRRIEQEHQAAVAAQLDQRIDERVGQQLRAITERQVSIDTRLDQELERLRTERSAAVEQAAARQSQQQIDPEKTFALYAALAAFQAELPRISKNAEADVKNKEGRFLYKYGYADLAEVSNAILPVLGKHGLAWLTLPRMTPNGFFLRWMLTHKDGGTIWGDVSLPDPGRVEAQAFGSDLTYLRRYLLLSVTGCFPAGEDNSPPLVDDDGDRSARGNRTGNAYGHDSDAPSPPPAPRSQPAKAAAQGSPRKAGNNAQAPAQAASAIDQAKQRAQQIVSSSSLSWGEFADRYKAYANDENARWAAASAEQLTAFMDVLDAQLTAAGQTGEQQAPDQTS